MKAMKITVTSINTEEAVLLRGTSALGWRGKFGCPLVIGDAIFVPARSREYNLKVGNSLTVETSYDEIANVRLVAAGTPDTMRALDNPTDYEVTGTVTFVAPKGIAKISVRGLMFTLERKELNGIDPHPGQHLTFELRRLTLWDTAT